jgi:L-ascorbate metabolism protein UlaG (beta-lactamase superfamily)
MKITKFVQSCLLIETKGKRILVDPGSISLTDDMVNNIWTNIDVILITHKHSDHINIDAVNKIVERDNAIVYTSSEVLSTYPTLKGAMIKAGDILNIDDIKVEVTHAIHGYLPRLKGNGEIKENIGFIIDDGDKRLYITSDTICFNNDYQYDILCIPFTGNGLMVGIYDGCQYAKATNASLVIPVHFEHPTIKVHITA